MPPRPASRSWVLVPLLAAPLALAGCDAFGGGPAGTSAPPSKLRHWDGLAAGAAPGGAAALQAADSVDLYVSFVEGSGSPDEASDEAFEGQNVRRRPYTQDGHVGAPVTVALVDLDAVLAALQAHPLVAWIEPDFPVSLPPQAGDYVPLSHDYHGQVADRPSQPFEGQMLPWNVTMIGGDRSSARSGDGAGTVDVDVYVIDAGVDHPDVHVVEHKAFFPASAGAGSTLHGNHVAATIAARDDGEGMVGVAPGARVHSLDVFDASGTAPMSRLISAVAHVTAAKRARPERPIVVNMSVGAYTGTAALNALDEAVQRSVAAGVVYVVSAGNQRKDAALASPAHVPEALTVGAYDANRQFAFDFSNTGPAVDLLAPGVRVVSGADGGRYAMLDGTSMAAPHVAGAAALYLARTPSATPAQVAAALVAGGRDTVLLRGVGTTGRSVWLGSL